MTADTIIVLVTLLGAGVVFAAFARSRGRTVIRQVQRNLRDKIAKQNQEIAVLKDQVYWLEGRAVLPEVLQPLPPGTKNSKRSVLFLHNGTYHFAHLAAALRRRGWDAVVISNTPMTQHDISLPNSQTTNLFSDDPREFRARLRALFNMTPIRFRMVHFGGEPERNTGFFRLGTDQSVDSATESRWNFQNLKEKGVKIAYTTSGCFDGVRQSIFDSHNGACAHCAWQLRPDLCSDTRNTVWGEFLTAICDLVAIEADYAHEWRSQPFVYREPLTTALDHTHWHPGLEIPQQWRLSRADGELLVLHQVGNPAFRRFGGRDIRGTTALVAAVKRLQSENCKVKLVHPTNVPSREIRFLQAQADVIVDQLVIGRYGAQAREAMMLGKPTICHINRTEPLGVSELRCWRECPLIDATEETIYSVLKRLLLSAEERKRIGKASSAYAMKWHAADSAAERYEKIYDRIIADLPLDAEDIHTTDLP